MNVSRSVIKGLFMMAALASPLAHAHGNDAMQAPPSMSVGGELKPAPVGVADLKFRDFFKMPVGARGLELSEKLLSLNGKQVRILGYMAKAEDPTPGFFVLAPLPIELGDEDESLSDDLPASAVFVHVDSAMTVPYIPGLIKITGILSVGNQEEEDGHVSMVRLQLDPEMVADIVRMRPQRQAKQ